jgi:hypothetical protein
MQYAVTENFIQSPKNFFAMVDGKKFLVDIYDLYKVTIF